MVTPLVLISPAMAVGSGYYAPLEQAFAGRGWPARALPRRGFEPGLPPAGRGRDWAYADEIADIAAEVARARAEEPERPVVLLGHSLGGQLAVGHDLAHRPVDGIVAIGAAVPHHWQYPFRGPHIAALGLAVGPLTRAFGHLPRPAFGGPGASTLMREWARWVLTGRPPFVPAEPLRTPALVITLERDPYAVPRAVDAYARLLDPATTTRWTYTRTDVPPGGTTDHVRWVRTPQAVVERVVAWWAGAAADDDLTTP